MTSHQRNKFVERFRGASRDIPAEEFIRYPFVTDHHFGAFAWLEEFHDHGNGDGAERGLVADSFRFDDLIIGTGRHELAGPPFTAICIFWVNEPPTRKSMTTSHLVASLHPDHCRYFSACIHQPKTPGRGALKTLATWRRLSRVRISDFIAFSPSLLALVFVRFPAIVPARES
jgi:hypothetical protein